MKSKEGKLEIYWNREIVQSIDVCDKAQLKMLVYLHKNSVYLTRILIFMENVSSSGFLEFSNGFLYSLVV